MNDQLIAKLEALETRVALQEDHVEAQDRSIAEQQRQIDDLRKQLMHTHRMLKEGMESAGASDIRGDEPPPHY